MRIVDINNETFPIRKIKEPKMSDKGWHTKHVDIEMGDVVFYFNENWGTNYVFEKDRVWYSVTMKCRSNVIIWFDDGTSEPPVIVMLADKRRVIKRALGKTIKDESLKSFYEGQLSILGTLLKEKIEQEKARSLLRDAEKTCIALGEKGQFIEGRYYNGIVSVLYALFGNNGEYFKEIS